MAWKPLKGAELSCELSWICPVPQCRPTVRNFWRSHGACLRRLGCSILAAVSCQGAIAEVEKESLGEWTEEVRAAQLWKGGCVSTCANHMLFEIRGLDWVNSSTVNDILSVAQESWFSEESIVKPAGQGGGRECCQRGRGS